MPVPTEDEQYTIRFYEDILQHNPKDAAVVELLGCLYAEHGRVDEGLRMDRKLVRLSPDNPNAHYNLACSLALKKRRADALRSLREAVELGYSDVLWMCEDPDLSCLRDHPDFEALVVALRRRQKTARA